jgi:uncharacterized integral membrane protein
MQVARFLIAYGVVSVLGVLVSLFLAQNTQAERLTFFGQEVSTNLAWIMLAATVVGFLFALLLLLPGRIAATLHIWSLRKEARELDEELVWQSEQRDQLLAHHERLLTGHEWLLNAYQRTRGELDRALDERKSLQIQLANANDALTARREAPARRETTAPAPLRQLAEAPQRPAPRMRVAYRIPVASEPVNMESEEDEEALAVGAPKLPEPAIEPLHGVQPLHATVAEDESTSAKLDLAHSFTSLGERLACGMQWFTSRLDRSWQATRLFFGRLYSESRYRVDQAILQIRRLGAAMWALLKERLDSLRPRRADDQRRVSPVTHPR